jgi:hypothetical protein
MDRPFRARSGRSAAAVLYLSVSLCLIKFCVYTAFAAAEAFLSIFFGLAPYEGKAHSKSEQRQGEAENKSVQRQEAMQQVRRRKYHGMNQSTAGPSMKSRPVQ